MGIDQPFAHRQQQRAARGGDEAGLHQPRQRLGLAMAEAVIGVGRDQRLADGEEGDQRAHEVERGVDQRRQHAHRVGHPPSRRLGHDQHHRHRHRGEGGQPHQASRLDRHVGLRDTGSASPRDRPARRGGTPAGRAGGTAVLPELDQQRLQPEARPVRRPRHLADDMLGRDFRHALLQREAALQRPRLVGRPGADLAAAGAGGEIGVGLLGRGRRYRPFDAHLATQRLPVEQQRRLGLGQQVRALAAFSVGVEDEALGVVALQQHHAHRRRAVRPDRGHAHGRGIVGLAFGRFFVPFAEKRQRIRLFPNHDHNMRGCGRRDHRHLVPIAIPR